MRFYQVDKVTELCPGKYVEGVKCVSLDNDVFDQHFPGYPIYPGTLLIEGMAQLSGMFLEWSRKEMGCKPRRAVLSLVQKFKFRGMAVPGDRLVYRADVKCLYPDEYGAVKVKALRDGRVCAEGELLFTFLDILDNRMSQESDALMRFATQDARIVR
ncbi:MAG: beta-hydroxyacyl-ACP dehydratase [Bacteroidales bacterium]|nr:beta-hydroxyacyl-ACP dehydratase [Bacteroidales bacterium]